MTGYGLVLAVMVGTVLKETNRHPDPHAMRPSRMVANYGVLLADRVYRGALLTGCGAFAALFAFISGSPFACTSSCIGMSPQQMGLAFGANVTGFMVGSVLSARLSRRLGAEEMIRSGVFLGASAAAADGRCWRLRACIILPPSWVRCGA